MNERVSFDLTGKQALVTGGRRGIGLAIARALRDQGAEVVVTGVREGRAQEEGFPFRRLDLRDRASVAALAADFDGLDILINNAGALVREGKEYDPPVFERIVDTNLNGTYRMCHAFFPGSRPAGAVSSTPCPWPPSSRARCAPPMAPPRPASWS